MLRDRAQAVVAGETAAVLQLEPAEVEVALVVHDQHRVRLDLEELRSGADRAPGLVHVRLGLEQGELVPVDADLGQLPVELRLPRAAVPARELLDDHPADVVPVARVLTARVAEADDEKVQGRAFAARPKPHQVSAWGHGCLRGWHAPSGGASAYEAQAGCLRKDADVDPRRPQATNRECPCPEAGT